MYMKTLSKITLLLCSCLLFLDSVAQQMNSRTTDSLVSIREFSFRANNAYPARGTVINLTSPYDLTVKKDTMVAVLPYFGRAFQAPISSEDAGINFTSTKFTWEAKKKKQRWNITIKPRDTRDARQLYLSISPDGHAQLQVLSLNREMMRFDGYVEWIK